MLFLPCVFAEWPPEHCDRNVHIVRNSVQLTSTQDRNVQKVCTLAQEFSNVVQLQITRTKGNSKSSIIGVSVLFGANSFDIKIRSDMIELKSSIKSPDNLDKKRCLGIFDQEFSLRLNVHSFSDLDKTIISVSTARQGENRFQNCFRFEIERLIPKYKLKLYGITDSGMDQWVTGLQVESSVEFGANMNVLVEHIDGRVTELEKRVNRLQGMFNAHKRELTTINYEHRNTQEKQEKHHAHTEQQHLKLQETIGVYKYTTIRNLYNYSYFTFFVFMLIIIAGCMAIRILKHYIRSKDHII